MGVRYESLGPLNAGEGSRAVLGLMIRDDTRASPVVLIWVPPGAANDRTVVAEIRKETEHAGKLDHPNIIRVFGFASVPEGQARVVEYADGESLRRLLSTTGALPPRLAARVVIDICQGAHYAHLAGNDDGSALVHGDLRPETVIVSYAGVAKVSGYGALAFAPREVGGQRVRGRRVHSSPEQILGGRQTMSVATDVYLAGITLYECLTGVVPWVDQGEGFDQAVLTLPLPPARPGTIPDALMPVLEKACSKKAAHRYPSSFALKEAIETAMGGEIASAEEVSAYVSKAFPDSAILRANRQQVVDKGIAEYMRRQWARKSFATLTPVADVKPAAPPAPVHLPVAPPARPMPAAPKNTQSAYAQATEKVLPAVQSTVAALPPVRRRDATPMIAMGVTVVIAGGLGVVLLLANQQKQPEPTPPVVVPFDAGQPAAVVVEVPDAAVEPFDAGLAAVPMLPEPDPLSPIPKELATTEVAIDSKPGGELFIDDKSVGATPFSGQLTRGRKVLRLVNKSQRLKATRVITVGETPVDQTFTFEMGFVAVRAPDGAKVHIDGDWAATMPMTGEIPVYEGSHRIEVFLGKAKWQQGFTVSPGQRVNFNVNLQE
jgi:eukaryotic-like serine/threonine-protein kinase